MEPNEQFASCSLALLHRKTITKYETQRLMCVMQVPHRFKVKVSASRGPWAQTPCGPAWTAGHTIGDLPVCPSNQISLHRAVVSHCFIEKHTYIKYWSKGTRVVLLDPNKRNHITKGIDCQLGVVILHTRVVVPIKTSATGHKSRAV